jgi:hypothetical protein
MKSAVDMAQTGNDEILMEQEQVNKECGMTDTASGRSKYTEWIAESDWRSV